MNRALTVLLCMFGVLTVFCVVNAGVGYKGGGKSPDKGGYAQQNVNGPQPEGRAQHGVVIPSSETIFSNEGRVITQGGDDIVKESGVAIGVVRPPGEARWFGDGNKEVVPQRANQNINEVGNNPALRQPQTQSDIEQSQNTRTVSMKELSDGTFTDGTKTYTIDDKGCLIDAESGEKTQYYIPDSKCARERNVESQERFCKAQEPISTKEANRIAYGRSLHFTSSRKEELAMVILKDGNIEDYKYGDSKSVRLHSSAKTFIHIHSHPFHEAYSGWPSRTDVVSMLKGNMWLKEYLLSNNCSQDRSIYYYIVHFGSGTGQFEKLSDGRRRGIYVNAGRMLIRYDESGVYKVFEDGEEQLFNLQEIRNQTWCATEKENCEILSGERNPNDVGNEAFNFNDAAQIASARRDAAKELRGQNASAAMKSDQFFLYTEDASDIDIKKALEEFHKKFLAMPNSQFKWQQIQAYLDLVISLQSWTLPPEKVLNKLVQEGSIIRTRNNTWKDLVESPLASDDSKSCWVKEKVGICGWCRCQPPHKTPKYEHAWLGACAEARAFDGQREQNDGVGLLLFPVCKQCGKCYTYRRMGEGYDDLIHNDVNFHISPYIETVEEQFSQTHKRTAAVMKMEDAILSIPDGEIVFPIKRICQCKHSRDKKPNIFAFYERQGSQEMLRRYICADCSGLYSPNNTCNSTAK